MDGRRSGKQSRDFRLGIRWRTFTPKTTSIFSLSLLISLHRFELRWPARHLIALIVLAHLVFCSFVIPYFEPFFCFLFFSPPLRLLPLLLLTTIVNDGDAAVIKTTTLHGMSKPFRGCWTGRAHRRPEGALECWARPRWINTHTGSQLGWIVVFFSFSFHFFFPLSFPKRSMLAGSIVPPMTGWRSGQRRHPAAARHDDG